MARPDPELIRDVSNTTAGVARLIQSPKNDPEDLNVLAETLETTAETLRIISRTWTASLVE